MNTPAHIIAAAALLTKRNQPARNKAALIGAIIPDASIFIFFAWCQLQGLSMRETWGEAYWTEPWQTIGAISNSAPLALLLLGVGYWRKLPVLMVFAAALLIHGALDFPLHADDAHKHFWPLTDWRFHSPVSYWDPAHHSSIGAGLEFAIMLAGIIILWRRFDRRWVRGLLGITLAVYTLGAAYLLYRYMSASACAVVAG